MTPFLLHKSLLGLILVGYIIYIIPPSIRPCIISIFILIPFQKIPSFPFLLTSSQLFRSRNRFRYWNVTVSLSVSASLCRCRSAFVRRWVGVITGYAFIRSVGRSAIDRRLTWSTSRVQYASQLHYLPSVRRAPPPPQRVRVDSQQAGSRHRFHFSTTRRTGKSVQRQHTSTALLAQYWIPAQSNDFVPSISLPPTHRRVHAVGSV